MKKTHCKRGHPKTPENTNAQGQCMACNNLWSKARQKERRRNDPEYAEKCRKSSRDRNRMLYKNYPERKRNEARKRHGWTQEAVEIALVQQNNKCAICNEVFTAMPCADHAHTTPPTPRGLLCRKHNLLLGHANDDVAILEASIAYLKKYGDKQ